MKMIQETGVNQVIHKLATEFTLGRFDGVRDSRNGSCKEMYNVSIQITNPRDRHINLPGRKNNLAGTLAEVFWVLSGDDKLEPVMPIAVPRCFDYSDDGETWRGAYGPRIFGSLDNSSTAVGQFSAAMKCLVDDPDSRRAVISIYDPSIDNYYVASETKDVPCNNLIYFNLNSGRLDMTVVQRSADLIWGFGNINVVEFTIMQEIMLWCLMAEGLIVGMGKYNHYINNLHVYEFTEKQARDIASHPEPETTMEDLNYTSPNYKDWRDVFRDIYEAYFILHSTSVCQEAMAPNFTENFTKTCLYDYFLVSNSFLRSKARNELQHFPNVTEDLRTAMKLNYFYDRYWK